jgi:SpoVK/Ycf46/Vps4 family AAA+-type ATPase
MDPGDAVRRSAAKRFVETTGGAIAVTTRAREFDLRRVSVALDVPPLTRREQHALWQSALESAPHNVNGQSLALASQFNLGVTAIHAAAREALGRQSSHGQPSSETDLDADLWAACRARARPALADLGQRIEPRVTWEDLVLPAARIETLHEIAVHVRQRYRVYDEWGFAARRARGLGISALFWGPSGTGKTMAAEVLGNELNLDLYRIDLSSVVSKFIGETEKNLRRIFDAAEAGGAILLFDEADALFGKRSEVRDSHDRYANVEISYLLQRMEEYCGLAILTTNMKTAMDTAFQRRIRFVVQFPFPDAKERAEIWRRSFPSEAPTEGLDPSKLARLDITGGNIRNIALNAAFRAADERSPVQMRHLLSAARSEYAKMERPLTDAETREWLP